MKKTRYSESQIFQIQKEAKTGIPVPGLWCTHGMSNAGFYKWRAKYGGLDVSSQRSVRSDRVVLV